MEAHMEPIPVFHVGQRVSVRHTGCSPAMPTSVARHIGRPGTVQGYQDGMYLVALDEHTATVRGGLLEHMDAALVKFYAIELQTTLR